MFLEQPVSHGVEGVLVVLKALDEIVGPPPPTRWPVGRLFLKELDLDHVLRNAELGAELHNRRAQLCFVKGLREEHTGGVDFAVVCRVPIRPVL